MKKIIALLALVLLTATLSWAQESCVRHKELAGGFSYCPPAGWVSRASSSGGPYKSFFTPENSPYRANLNVKEEATTASHELYMMSALRNLLDGNEIRGVEARKVVGWTEFKTDSNISGSRMVYELQYQGVAMRTIQVILDLPGKKLLLTGTALVSSKETTDKLFDAVAKSLSTR